MDVFLDTQSINKQHFLNRPPASLLFEKGPEAGHRIVVPEVVLLEMVTHFREALEKALADARKGIEALQSVILRDLGLSVPGLDLDREVVVYETWLREELAARGCEVAPLPNLGDGRQMIQRDLARRRPFDAKGRGLRDAVLWETILDRVTTTGHKAALITGNLTDFCNGQAGTIHPDLQLDLIDHQIGTDMVAHFETISQFLEAEVMPVTAQLQLLREQLQTGSYAKFSLESWLIEEVGQLLLERDSQRMLHEAWPDSRDVSAELDELYDIELQTLLPLDAGVLYVEGAASANLLATVRGRRGALGLPRPRPRFEESVWDELWDDDLVTADGELVASLSFGLQLLPDGAVDETSVELEWVRPAGGLDVR